MRTGPPRHPRQPAGETAELRFAVVASLLRLVARSGLGELSRLWFSLTPLLLVEPMNLSPSLPARLPLCHRVPSVIHRSAAAWGAFDPHTLLLVANKE